MQLICLINLYNFIIVVFSPRLRYQSEHSELSVCKYLFDSIEAIIFEKDALGHTIFHDGMLITLLHSQFNVCISSGLCPACN